MMSAGKREIEIPLLEEIERASGAAEPSELPPKAAAHLPRITQPVRLAVVLAAGMLLASGAGGAEVDLPGLFQRATEAIRRDDYDAAGDLVAKAYRQARQTKAETSLLLAKAMVARVATLRREYTATANARRRLAQDPTDGLARKILGCFHCFVKEDLKRGLPLLAQCGDAKLREAAALDGKQPDDPAQQVALADLWWSGASNTTGLSRRGMRQRAALWYRKAYSRLTGEDKRRAGERIISLVRLDRDGTIRPDPVPLHAKLTWKELDTALGVRFSGVAGHRPRTGFYLTSTADNRSQQGVIKGVLHVEGRILCRDGNGRLNVIRCRKDDLQYARRGEQPGGLWGNCKTKTVRKRNAGSAKPINYYVAVLIGDVIIHEAFLTTKMDEPWWLDDSLVSK